MDNRSFWNNRYVDHPWLGSGPGSRGIAQFYKASILRKILAHNQISSIVDVGCGDLCWLKSGSLFEEELQNIDYLGLDISEKIIEHNQTQFPELNFAAYNLESDSVPQDADLVICMDVLIHQTNKSQFESCLSNLMNGINKYGLISYRNPDRSKTPITPIIEGFDEAEEISFRTLADTKKEQVEIARADTAVFDSLPTWPILQTLNLMSRHVGDYRYQSLYELSSTDWLKYD